MNDNHHVLKAVGIKVLQEWGLMVAEEVPPAACVFESGKPLYLASMHFEGVFRGTVYLSAQRPFMDMLARNLLGYDSEDSVSTDNAEDALREMANVVLGNFLTEAYGTDTPFSLTNPSVTPVVSTSTRLVGDIRNVYHFLADDQPLSISFVVTG